MGIPLVPDQGKLSDPCIGLAQIEAGLFRQCNQLLARPVQQLGIGGEHDVLRLYRGIDDDPARILRLHRPGLYCNRHALLQQDTNPLLAHALSTARQRRPVEGKLMQEERLAAEELGVWILHLAGKELLVGEIERMLEDRRPCHQPGRERRHAGAIAAAPVSRRSLDLARIPSADLSVE